MKYFLSGFFLIFVFTGCSFKAPNNEDLKYKALYSNAEFKKASSYIENNSKLLNTLESANMQRFAKEYKESNKNFDLAETFFKDSDMQGTTKNIFNFASSVVLNNTIHEYTPKVYDKIMVNTYKGLNYMMLKNFNQARVEFNRAIYRQKRAKEYFSKEIEKEKEKIQNQKKKDISAKSETLQKIEAQYTNLFAFNAYKDFINPYTSYLAGLFFYLDRDYDKASDMFKQALGMDENNEVFQNDFILANQKASSLNVDKSKTYTWIIIEDGLRIKSEEKRINIPLFLVSDDVVVSVITLPYLKDISKIQAKYQAKQDDTVLDINEISSMNKVIKTEFKKRFPLIVTRQLSSAIAKSYLQYEASKNSKGLLSFASVLFTLYTSKADTRIWSTLPKQFFAMRVLNSESNIEILDNNSTSLVKIKPSDNNRVVYMRNFDTSHRSYMVDEVQF